LANLLLHFFLKKINQSYGIFRVIGSVLLPWNTDMLKNLLKAKLSLLFFSVLLLHYANFEEISWMGQLWYEVLGRVS